MGNYETALIYFDGVISQISQYDTAHSRLLTSPRYLRTVEDPELQKKWAKARTDLTAEFQTVKDILAELNSFKVHRHFREPAHSSIDSGIEERCDATRFEAC